MGTPKKISKQPELTEEQMKKKQEILDCVGIRKSISFGELHKQLKIWCLGRLHLMNSGIPISSEEIWVLKDWMKDEIDAEFRAAALIQKEDTDKEDGLLKSVYDIKAKNAELPGGENHEAKNARLAEMRASYAAKRAAEKEYLAKGKEVHAEMKDKLKQAVSGNDNAGPATLESSS